eukprot:TRINITY_DN66986_c4_g8_i1.p1 TRINITY_DN66986_c4_g8~~TRINITY_DN66986_c4_g8_i1.p1  ORF type:complete len:546 (-),score=-13.37 TRINITY_DN66986_c4_g8_i1:63-1700(-)
MAFVNAYLDPDCAHPPTYEVCVLDDGEMCRDDSEHRTLLSLEDFGLGKVEKAPSPPTSRRKTTTLAYTSMSSFALRSIVLDVDRRDFDPGFGGWVRFALKWSWHLRTVILASIVMLVTASLNLVFLNKASRAMHPLGYPDPFPMVFMSSWAYPLIYGILLAVRWKRIRKYERLVKQWQLAILGFFQFWCAICITFAVPHVSALVQVVLSSTVLNVPLGAVLSAVLLKRRYHWTQLACLCVVVGGITLSVVAELTVHGGKVGKPSLHIPSGAWSMIFSSAAFFSVGIRIFEEKIFTSLSYPQSVIYVQFNIFVWQQIWLVLLGPCFDVLPQFGTCPAQWFYPVQKWGARCVLGGPFPKWPHMRPQIETCENYVAMYSMCSQTASLIITELMALYLLKESSALLVFVIATIATPLAAIAMAQGWIMHPFTPEKLSPFFGGALAVLVLGMLGYAWCTKMYAPKKPVPWDNEPEPPTDVPDPNDFMEIPDARNGDDGCDAGETICVGGVCTNPKLNKNKIAPDDDVWLCKNPNYPGKAATNETTKLTVN